MNSGSRFLKVIILSCALCGAALKPGGALAASGGQQASASPAASRETLKVQSNLVLVDAVVTGKHDHYVTSLDAKDFKIFQDGKEQKIVSFSRPEAAMGASGPAQRHYIVLLFDISSVNLQDQQRIRLVGEKFIEKYTAPDRPMAIVNFDAGLQIAQNFTDNAARLYAAVSGAKVPLSNPSGSQAASSSGPGLLTAVSAGAQQASLGFPTMGGLDMSGFSTYSFLLALRALAQDLRSIPGRKVVILFSTGFDVMNPEALPDLTAAIDACNRANVAIYPVDVRGLVPPGSNGAQPGSELIDPAFPRLPFELASLLLPLAPDPQQGGRGPGGAGGIGPGGPGGGRGPGGPGSGPSGGGPGGASPGGGQNPGSGGNGSPGRTGGNGRPAGGSSPPVYSPNSPFYQNPTNQPQIILPHMPRPISDPQMELRALALGTGGFGILNTDNFSGGLERIAAELNEYYVLGYNPPPKPGEGACHTIEVKVGHGLHVRFRSGYCDVPGTDLLAGKAEGKALEEAAAGASPGTIPISVEAPYFYTAPNVARVELSLSIPGSHFVFRKAKDNLESNVNILGIAYRADGSVAARFSDSQTVHVEKAQKKVFEKQPFVYRNSFAIAPGKYNLKVVVSPGGKAYSKASLPIEIEPFSGKQFQMAGIALSDTVMSASEEQASLAAQVIEGQTPLVVNGLVIFPSPTNRFSRPGQISVYSQIFDPALVQNSRPQVVMYFRIVNAENNALVYKSSGDPVSKFIHAGNPVIPVAMWLSTNDMSPGTYRLDLWARDADQSTPVQSAQFVLQ